MKNNDDWESLKRQYSFDKEIQPHFKRKDLWTSVFVGIAAGLITNHITGFHWYVILIGIAAYVLVCFGIFLYREKTEPPTENEMGEQAKVFLEAVKKVREKQGREPPTEKERREIAKAFLEAMERAEEKRERTNLGAEDFPSDQHDVGTKR